ncbi:hypothetical protein [Microvirga antarctica]|uniref:hypothetical protein n=1 Tax=Microvirga antarctica TaxID=2819233 RepID=UPI001B30D944|nr:hypothetical protein [Microvirga antarctica]
MTEHAKLPVDPANPDAVNENFIKKHDTRQLVELHKMALGFAAAPQGPGLGEQWKKVAHHVQDEIVRRDQK